MAARAAAHVPLPKITMSNSVVGRRFSRLISTANTASQQQPRSSVGAGYRCGVRASQTLKRQNIQFFPVAFPAPAGGRETPTYRAQGPDLTPYMGQPRFPVPPTPKTPPSL